MAATKLVPLGKGIWSLDDAVHLPGGARLPLRATLFSLETGGLALHSPVAMSEELTSSIKQLGEVRHIIAPSALHHLHLQAARQAFAQAKIHAPRALLAKVPELRVDGFLGDGLSPELGATIEAITMAGAPDVEETVFFHMPSRTLLVTDLLFHVTRPEGALTKLVLTCTGTCGRLAQSRVWYLYAKDKRAFAQSTRQMLEWDFDRLIPCHGEVLETGAKAAIEAVLRWK